VLGLSIALATRLLLLFTITWIAGLVQPLFTVFGQEFSGRDLIMLGGGLFLLVKGVRDIHARVEEAALPEARVPAGSLAGAITQIVLLDIVFSFDSVITAVGIAREFWVMAAAVIIAVVIMLVASGPVVRFIQEHPTIKMLALSFVLLIGVALVAEGFQFHIPRGYIYFAMAFSVMVETLNIIVSDRRKRMRAQRPGE
jgi:predicted tellurium resistance membrane protein TerC